jgi:homoserine kinase
VTLVRVPASSANLGPGFDALGMALTIHAEVGVVDGPPPEGGRLVDERHPADVAFRRAGGHGELWVRSPIPSGRGLGFSGAMRVGGLLAAAAQRTDDPALLEAQRPTLLEVAIEMEGHADNVAASLYGGVIATAAGRVVPVPLALDPAVVLWVARFTTRTEKSRAALGDSVSFSDAVFNVGRTALLVAALAAGDIEALRWGMQDRLHQDLRFAAAIPSRTALADGLEAGAWCGWLSGSGPTVAFLCDPADTSAVAAALPADGDTRTARIAAEGAVVIG